MKQGIIAIVSSITVSTCLASNPASTDYVNKQIAAAKAQLVSQIVSIPAVSHPVGSCYGGGVVFYVNSTPNAPEGKRGLIAALSDANGGLISHGQAATSPSVPVLNYSQDPLTQTVF